MLIKEDNKKVKDPVPTTQGSHNEVRTVLSIKEFFSGFK